MRRHILIACALAAIWAPRATAFYGNGYRYCRQLTIDADLVSGAVPLVDFPVLISLTDPELRHTASGGHVEHPNGFDIIFLDESDSIVLEHEIERYDAATGEIVMWVEVPSLSPITDTIVHVYYGNPAIATSQENVAGTWSNGYEAVYHFGGGVLDSSPNGYDGIDSGTTDTMGLIGRGRDFTPLSEIDVGNWSVSGSALTLQAWVRWDDFDQDDPRVISKGISRNDQDHAFMLGLGETAENRPRARVKTGGSDASGTTTLFAGADPVTTGVWTLLASTYDGSTFRIFADAVELTSVPKTGSLHTNGWPIRIGNNPNNADPAILALDGQLDELRVSAAARSASWLATEVANHTNPGVGPGLFIESVSTELECIGLELVKRAFLLDGTPVADGSTLPSGTRVRYLIYVNNPGASQIDVSMRDVLDPAFVYAAGTLKVANPPGACAADACSGLEESAILAAVDATAPLTEVVDGDVASVTGSTIEVGNRSVANARADIASDSVLALLFTVTIE